MALHKMKNPLLDLSKDNNNDKTQPGKGGFISDHKKEFVQRIKRLERDKAGLKKENGAIDTEIKESEKEVLIDLKDNNREQSTERKLSSARDEKISKIKKQMDNLEVAIEKEAPKPQPTKCLEFPKGFLWGTASSAYQVEGGIKNDWSIWEKSAKRKMKLIKEKKHVHDFICGDACDSYNRYKEDFRLARKMKNNAIRFGLEWARIQPKRDTWNVYAIKHYREMIKTAKEMGFITVVTLWHWTLPTWIANTDGWTNKKTIEDFKNYVDLVIKELGADIDYWVVLNEPMMYVFGAYLKAYHPPQKRSLVLAEKALKNLVQAQKQAYDQIHEYYPKAQVGYAAMLNYFEPASSWNPWTRLLARGLHHYWNARFINKTRNSFDYMGINYYFHDRIIWRPPFKKNKNIWVSDKGWEIYPKGIYKMLKFVNKYNKPIIITENGLADAEDKNRVKFIKEHLAFIHKAIEDGVDVQGYFHWSLLDNFEWSYGWTPKFGLYKVDRETFKRTPRPSAKEYGEICKTNSVEIEI
ncbi:family 1 glycosylhydrolase [Candidatus Parcubacteria bacterium]|nr:family 1 glycosylhydrolase [Candidatus Parcubacteria bacterium]